MCTTDAHPLNRPSSHDKDSLHCHRCLRRPFPCSRSGLTPSPPFWTRPKLSQRLRRLTFGPGVVAPSSGHVRACPTGSGFSGPGKEWVCPSSRSRSSPLRGQREHDQAARRIGREDRQLPEDARRQTDDSSADREITFPLGPDKKGRFVRSVRRQGSATTLHERHS
jgi:hypothetical protein